MPFNLNPFSSKATPSDSTGNSHQQNDKDEPISQALTVNRRKLEEILSGCPDVKYRQLRVHDKEAMLLYIDGLSDLHFLSQHVLQPLLHTSASDLETIALEALTVPNTGWVRTFAECVDHAFSGSALLFLDNEPHALSIPLAGWEQRGVEEPQAESVVRGPREGFTETLAVNISMLRRKIKSPALKLHTTTVGRYSKSMVAIAYLEGIAEETLVRETKERIDRIDIDGALESAYLEELILDKPYSPFPQVLTTERPDVIAGNLFEGRVAILMDGTPIAMVAPITLFSLLQSPEDYYQHFLMSTLIRWLRYGAALISLLLPSVYVAVLSFHHEMVPSLLFFTIVRSREEIPFPAIVEALMMEVAFEALREAGVKLPKQIGPAVSIVGALIIGDAAVSAGIVSATMVMVVAITGIASFMLPKYSVGMSLRLLRFPIMLLSSILGLFGTMLGVLALVIHLSTLRSFGVPYLSPIGPFQRKQWKDVGIRAPWWKMTSRPHLTGKYNSRRQTPISKPDPSKGNE
ncbi:spore germination protein [Paenibacillus methanolicus]|uniref:Spore germination protein KA n=1 Tax=Paenibacillus methanolicus TaxID=582686 RepID=A0A5S5C0P8_9BACL|nr:spore germination protein [Paenibacillus methanolicus]TYP71910.1 spore germination protein KA [Paenibacillus methanolicus]